MESLGVYLFAGAFCLICVGFRSGICLAPSKSASETSYDEK